MSRICVKNLPKYLTDERLREHFAGKGEVTDAKIIRTRDGQSRQFGFVGFRTEEEAAAAVKYFNRSFLDTSRLCCELAEPIGGSGLPRPWSRHSLGSSAFVNSHKVSHEEEYALPVKKATHAEDDRKDIAESDDPQLQEFLQVMQPRHKSKLWADDTLLVANQLVEKNKNGQKGSATGIKTKTYDKARVTSMVEQGDGKALSPSSDISGEHENIDEAVAVGTDKSLKSKNYDGLVEDAMVSDLDYLKSRVKMSWSDDEEDSESGRGEGTGIEDEEDGDINSADVVEQDGTEDMRNKDALPKPGKSADGQVEGKLGNGEHDVGSEISSQELDGKSKVVAEEQESVAETGRLFVRNLSYSTSEDDLVELFSKYGELSQVHLVLDKDTKRSKGFAYVLFMLPEAAVRAMNALDKSIFQGRLLHILPATRPPPVPEKDIHLNHGPGMSKFKQEREAQRKETEASGNSRAWNSLFMHPDTIAENVARKYGLSKSDFLDPEAEDLAVRMALGETHIIAETKKALIQEGVNVEILEELASGKLDKVKRSNHIILVKNLPFTTLDRDLVSMFGKFGTLDSVVLPSTKSLALVVFLEAAEARAAFKGLAYKRFKHVPLYLEWAPNNIFHGETNAGENKKNSNVAVGEDQIKRMVLEQELAGVADDVIDTDTSKSCSVFVKNLNFNTTEEVLKQHFQRHLKHGAFRNVTIKMKKAKNGKLLSMGFGFIELDSAETARDVCKQLQGSVVEGHALLLQLCAGRKSANEKEATVKAKKDQSSTKMIVRNVPFEATKKDLRQLFSPFGQIKSLRLPKKFDGNHRGFAFVEFVTKQEAENAYKALASTHLYGRHLVLERAKERESVEQLRTRIATQFSEIDENSGQIKLSKKRKHKDLIDDINMHFGRIAE